jgi:hypothetical protein
MTRILIIGMCILISSFAHASGMPEPLISESVTDIDSTEAGEVEVDLTESILRATSGESDGIKTSVEAEWRATKRLGLSAEISTSSDEAVGFSGAASWALLHDFKRGFHLQAEVGGQTTHETEVGREWEDASLPFFFGLRAGLSQNGWTLRAGVGGQAFGPSAHSVPARASLALFHGFGLEGQTGFIGTELITDWARPAPFFAAPEIVVHFSRWLPLSLGVAVPLSPGTDQASASWGVVIRAIYEFERDVQE